MITVDGVEWNVPCDIERMAEVKASDISGMLMNRLYLNDVLGTYMQYDVKLVPVPAQMGEYYALYEALTQPVGEHSFTFPYNGETITVTGRMSNIRDVYVRMPGGGVYWKGVRFSVIANAPSKTMSLSNVIAHGLPEYPPDYAPEEGDTYAWSSANGWEQVSSYEDADLIAF